MTAAVLTLPLWIVLVLPFAKILATSLSIGSGRLGRHLRSGDGDRRVPRRRPSGGSRTDLPAVPHSPAPFVVVGMIACFGSIAHAPLAVMLMVAEMTGSLEMLAPAMVAVGLASVVVGDATIYTSQLRNRTESPAHRFRFGLPLLASLPVTQAMRTPRLTVDAASSVREVLDALIALGLEGAPVRDEAGRFKGSVEAERLVDRDPEDAIGQACDPLASTVPIEANLDAVMETLAVDHTGRVTVLDTDRRIVGEVSASDLILVYRRSLEESLHRLGSSFRGATLLEEEVRAGAAAEGWLVSDGAWPRGTIVMAIQRGEQLIFPESDTRLRAGDVVSILAPAGKEFQLRSAMGGSGSASGEGGGDQPLI